MKHFTDETWLDYARGVLPATQMDLLRQHLDAGCTACRRVCQLWLAVAQTLKREPNYQPAEAVVQGVHSAVEDVGRSKLLPLRARMARVLFDSFRQPAAAVGVRSASARARQMLHRSGSWTIDLRLENEAGRRLTVAGQVLKSGRKAGEALTMDVILMRGDTVLTKTATNEFGEFWLECDYQTDLHVYLDIAGCRPVGIVLPDPDR